VHLSFWLKEDVRFRLRIQLVDATPRFSQWRGRAIVFADVVLLGVWTAVDRYPMTLRLRDSKSGEAGRSEETAVSTLSQQIAAMSRVLGTRLRAISDTPNVPHKSCGCGWMSVEVAGRQRMRKPETRFAATGWTLMDVYGRPWMAPRAGYQTDCQYVMRKDRGLARQCDPPSDTLRARGYRQ
jgi:hypothetical protein